MKDIKDEDLKDLKDLKDGDMDKADIKRTISLDFQLSDMQHLQKTLRFRELKEQNAGFSAQIHRVSLTKTWFKKKAF